MRISYAWLCEYLEGDVPDPARVADLLTDVGLEVETVERPGDALKGVVVGEVKTCEPHPDADKLKVTTVDDGQTIHEVVCGAPNVRAGLKVPFAGVGLTLPNGLTLEARKVRGVLSKGMLCSASELGITEDASGLLELDEGLAPGTELAAAIGLDDVIFELGVTPNRPDALSHLGVARDLAVAAGLTLKPPTPTVNESGAEAASLCKVTIEAPEKCARYAARVIEGVTLGPSPAWLQKRLTAAGVRPISNVVDVTNYVLMELGHPLHAFDLDKLADHHIIVRTAGDGEKMHTLDDAERTLTSDDLVIADATHPVAIAGVMGGADSEVGEGTTRLLLESAWFEPVSVRKTAKAQGLHTEASHRFERGADPEGVRLSADRAASLIAELAGGEVRVGTVDVVGREIAAPEVTLRHERVTGLLGLEIPIGRQKEILLGLGFTDLGDEDGATRWRAPSYRVEMDRPADLIEELARIEGYDKIPSALPTRGVEDTRDRNADARHALVSALSEAARAGGLVEVLNYSFVSPDDLDRTNAGGEAPTTIPLANPLTFEQSVMRTSVAVSLLGNLDRNRRFHTGDVRIYEVGRAYLEGEGGVEEPLHLGLLVAGRRRPMGWTEGEDLVDFAEIKGIVEGCLRAVDQHSVQWVLDGERPWLHPRQSARLMIGEQIVGVLGALHPAAAKAWDLPREVFLAELDIEALHALASPRTYDQPINRFPDVLRDVALVVDEAVTVAEVDAALTAPLPEAEAIGATVAEVRLFDVYTGPQVGEGRQSLAFAIRYRADDRTLTDDEASKIHDALVARAEKSLGAELRG